VLQAGAAESWSARPESSATDTSVAHDDRREARRRWRARVQPCPGRRSRVHRDGDIGGPTPVARSRRKTRHAAYGNVTPRGALNVYGELTPGSRHDDSARGSRACWWLFVGAKKAPGTLVLKAPGPLAMRRSAALRRDAASRVRRSPWTTLGVAVRSSNRGPAIQRRPGQGSFTAQTS